MNYINGMDAPLKNPTAKAAIANLTKIEREARSGKNRARPLTASEGKEQQWLFDWAAVAERAFPELRLMHHIPNGGQRNKRTAAILKAQGVKAGVPDICLPVARDGYHGLYIELKAGVNRATANQNAWLKNLAGQGYKTAVCYGWQAAKDVITRYLEGQEWVVTK